MRGDTASHRHGVGLGKSCADTASPMASYPLEGQGRAFVTPLTIQPACRHAHNRQDDEDCGRRAGERRGNDLRVRDSGVRAYDHRIHGDRALRVGGAERVQAGAGGAGSRPSGAADQRGRPRARSLDVPQRRRRPEALRHRRGLPRAERWAHLPRVRSRRLAVRREEEQSRARQGAGERMRTFSSRRSE